MAIVRGYEGFDRDGCMSVSKCVLVPAVVAIRPRQTALCDKRGL